MISIFALAMTLMAGAQVYWAWRIAIWIRGRIRARSRRLAIGVALAALYLLMLAYTAGWIGEKHTPIRLTAGAAFLSGPFSWWLACSLVAFLVVVAFRAAVFLARAPFRIAKRAAGRPRELESPARRVFLERTAGVIAAAPFVGGAYGALYGRLNLETPTVRIRIPRLPAAFEGFRIAQLSDIHIGPFMTERQIRKYAAIANSLRPDLAALTGDYVTWDAGTERPVVAALSVLKVPFGVFGCLGNHDAWAGVQDSITELFRQAGVAILRRERASIARGPDSLNLIGIDYTPARPGDMRAHGAQERGLDEAGRLADPHRVNILLSHNPNTFDRAAEFGIDLSLAGHTHGGQAALEFISPEIAPSRLVTPYVAGWFGKPGGQLYVNRGIGTIATPIRIGAPPEITLFELTRA
jgi:predicted MPP superfamily phosphohydrolase